MKIKNLLITAIGGDIAQSTARIIKQNRPEINLIGTDIATRHAGGLFVDNFYKVPSAADDKYLPSIEQLIKQFSIDVLLPMSEAELSILAKFNHKIGNCIIAHCGKKGLDIGLDKFKTNQFLKSINAPFPWTIPAAKANLADVNLPCILKPNTGSGSKGIFIIENKTDFEYHQTKHPNSVFQELLTPHDQEITCAIYRAKTNEVYVLQMLRQLIGGATGWAVVINEPHIEQLCVKVANELDIHGGINVQLINSKDNAYIFEINPRISSTVAMRDNIGFHDVMWILNEIEGISIAEPIIKKNKIMLKTCSVITL